MIYAGVYDIPHLAFTQLDVFKRGSVFGRGDVMKKLLILMLVLGMASAVEASLIWTDGSGTPISSIDVVKDSTATAYIYSDTADNYDDVEAGGDMLPEYTVTSVTNLPAAGDDASATYQGPTYPDWWVLKAAGSNLAAGLHWEVVIAGHTVGTYIDRLSTDGWWSIGDDDALTVNVVPEPITIALLGLGSLFLPRRRK